MTWLDELREEIDRQQPGNGRGSRDGSEEGSDRDVTQAGALVRPLLDQMNRQLLAGRGSVWETQARWGLRLWELWWGTSRAEGQHVIVTLLRDSQGTPYLKVQRSRLALRDPRLEQRLQRMLRAAFLRP